MAILNNDRRAIAVKTMRILIESMQQAEKTKDTAAFYTLWNLLKQEIVKLNRRG